MADQRRRAAVRGFQDTVKNSVNLEGKSAFVNPRIDFFDDRYLKLDQSIVQSISDANMITNLNSDLLDGLHSSDFLKLDQSTPQTITGRLTLPSIAVDTNTIYVDAVNHRLGVGTIAPLKKLHLAGLNTNDVMRVDTGLDFVDVTAAGACTATLAASPPGAVDIGDHRYIITFVTAIGETEKGAYSNSVTCSAGFQKIELTNIPVSTDYRVTQRKVYRTKIGDIYGIFLVATINDNVTTTYTDILADSAIGATDTLYYAANSTNMFIRANGEKLFIITEGQTALGKDAGTNLTTQAKQTTLFGGHAGRGISSGMANSIFGYYAGYSLATTIQNSIFGAYAGWNATGSNNTLIGHGAASQLTSGSGNTVLGRAAGAGITNKSYGVFLGYYAGRYETVEQKLFIDSLDRVTETRGRTESLIYGVFSSTLANQVLSLGGGGNVGISTIAPTARLHLPAGEAGAGRAPLKLTSGTLNTAAEAGAIEFLTDDYFATITTGTARKGFILDDGSRLTPGTIPVATTNGRLINLTAQAHEANAKTDYTTGNLDTEAEIISAINATNTTINNLLAKLETLKLLAAS